MQHAILLLLLLAPAEPRTWTDQAGKYTITATLVEVQDGDVLIKKEDGEIVKLPVAKLSLKDQQFLKSTSKPAKPKPAANRKIASAVTKPVEAMIELPERGTQDEISISVDGGKLSLDIQSPASSLCEFAIETGEDGASWTITNGTSKVAHLKRSGKNLAIGWEADCPDEAECLRNAVLVVKSDNDKSAIALRSPVEIDAPYVDLENKAIAIPIEAQLWGLVAKDLKMEAIGFRNNESHLKSRFPGNGLVDHNEPAKLVIRDERPHAGVALNLSGTTAPMVRVEPFFVDFKSKKYPWTDKQLKSLRTAFINEISRHEREIPKAEAAIPAMEGQLKALKRQFRPGAANSGYVASRISKTQGDINETRNRLKSMRANLPGMRTRAQAFGELYDLSESIHQQVRVRFRVFFVAGDSEVTVLRVTDS